ncbi:NAD(P)-dependent oxidoreductase [Candidatus Nitronereus thalassa]|uniref:NAD(P)-dependent oxidoreductase n=1 Tax=Candidatus Nitronereus thalassa TaxID=3020898 RepID=A0ABU3K3P9_9BACT|nr:NAD(P)-dependent oxidoreductase [Candidatus Nitronereus thalassa]MDT7041013.1 NAD(P)-dependent oxidoreductase [Candidatus Nitronereus thalassa]
MTLQKLLRLSSPLRLGWIGTGVMGAAMCQHLLKNSYPVTVYSRTRQKAEGLLANGAQWASSPSEVVKHADVVFTMVGFPHDVREVYCGDSGLLKSLRPNTVLVDMTTSLPSLAVEISAICNAKGSYFVDAPVSGGDVGAQQATLSIMVGGETEVVVALRPFFKILSQTINHQGPPGAGQHAKLCNQITIAGTMIGVCESLLYGYRAGLDLDTLLQSIRGGAAACWTLDHLAPRILVRNFEPGFYVDHFVKDMGMALEEAKRLGLVLPGLALVHQLYLSVQAYGHGRAGTHALMLALERLSNISGKEDM